MTDFMGIDIDGGTGFGLWNDPVSRLMYFNVMPHILEGVDITGMVADYGGANGLLKQFIPQAISIDIDTTKNPDIVDDIRTHRGDYNLIVMRYVLHYLTPVEQLALFRHIASYHEGKLLVIQFTNDGKDHRLKLENSVNEIKYFHTQEMLFRLFPDFTIIQVKTSPYQVTAEFYANRLGNPDGQPHGEVCNSILMRRT